MPALAPDDPLVVASEHAIRAAHRCPDDVLDEHGPLVREAIVSVTEVLRRREIIDEFRRSQATHQRNLAADMDTVFTQLGSDVEEAATKAGGLILEDLSDKARKRIESILVAVGLVAAGKAVMAPWVREHVEPVYRKHYQRVIDASLRTLERAGITISVRDSTIRGILNTGGRRAGLLDIAEDTRKAIFRTIADANELGWNPRTIARSIRKEVPAGRFVNAGSKYRAELIARSETLHAQRVSTIEVYKASAQVNQVQAFDGDGDPDCAARNGAIFSVSDAEFEMNSDSVHPNCVLAFAPVVV